MNFNTLDGDSIELEPLSDYLIRKHGFDPVFLAKDDFMLRLGVPEMTFFEQWRWIRTTGMLAIPSFEHFSRKYRKQNNAFVKLTDLISELEYFALIPAFEKRDDKEQFGTLDFLTRIARLIGKKRTLEIDNLIYKSSILPECDEFKTGIAYPTHETKYIAEDGIYYICVYSSPLDDDGDEDYFYFVSPSLFGFTSYIYVKTYNS